MDSYSYSPINTDNCLTFEKVRLWSFEQVTNCPNSASKVGSISPSQTSIESSIMSIESVKSRCIKVIGQDQTCTIPINDISDAKSILTRVLQKFNINEDVERYSLFTTTRCITDEELVQICKSSDRPERERLILRKKHIQMSHEEIQKQLRYKKLANFFGEKPPTTPQAPQVGISHKKLRNFFGQRPPSELISLNLTEFFPGHDSEELERSARNSIRRASRLSAASRYSKTKSRQSGNSVLKWIKGSLIGMGSFGSVYLGLNAITGALMAVKQVELPTGQSSNEERKKSMLDALQREITLLKELHHDHIVQYLEYVPGGSVSTMINNYGPLEETLVRSFVRQILSGLSYLHDKEIIHRDIKGANILVDEKGGIKISDFGISKKVEDPTSSHRPSLQGSVFWMAPEVVKQTAYTSKADIWSLGCLIVEMFTAREFLKKTFELNHDDRPAAKVLLAHPFALSTSVKSGTTSSP
ncbi:1019_t:CDS:10 [Diversispora eburnea]|uniref:1019_t:CDS:1 n=1 Tax=Diversispora eburnea TaxID=1213867 RepID=A0A9N9AWG4_9GLOM|nr:1019_t:CDS:10 [Diversispora eburnea]